MLRVFLFFFLSTFYIQAQSIEEIRKAYTTASESKEQKERFYQLMQGATMDTSVKEAYKGASLMMYSKQSGKLRTMLKEGKALIEGAIGKEPQNIELRMIRLSVQEHLPKVVPYRANIEEDRKFIQDHLSQQPQPLKKYIENYIND